MSKSYLNKVQLREGQVILFYHTANSKRPIYQMRIHVGDMNGIQGATLIAIVNRYEVSRIDDLMPWVFQNQSR